MKEITDIKTQRNRRRWNIFLDGQFAFTVSADVALKTGLKIGQRLEPSQIMALNSAQTAQSCLELALRYLNYRPRSEQELRQRLELRGFGQEVISKTIQQLQKMGLISNIAFARFWVEKRQACRPRSQFRLRQELHAKGVERETIESVVNGLDDETNAYIIAQKKQKTWDSLNTQSWHRRMGSYLNRHGFSYGIINKTLKRLESEKAGAVPSTGTNL